MNHTFVLITAAGLAAYAGPAEAEVPRRESSLEVVVDLVDAARSPKPLSLLLTLTGEHGCASVTDETRAAKHHIQACRDGGDDASPVVSFDVERVLNLESGSEKRQFRIKARLLSGRSQVIGGFGEGKEKMELRAVVRPLSSESRS